MYAFMHIGRAQLQAHYNLCCVRMYEVCMYEVCMYEVCMYEVCMYEVCVYEVCGGGSVESEAVKMEMC